MTMKKISATGLLLIACLTLFTRKAGAPTTNPKSLDEITKISRPNLKQPKPMPKTAEKIDYITDNFYNDSEQVLLARMLLGEAESCSEIEKIAVAYTALNRINDNQAWNGTTLREVLLKPRQYSCFNENINSKLKNPLRYNAEEFISSLHLAREILAGKYPDPTNGATHYLNPNHPDLKGKPLPAWTKKLKEVRLNANTIEKIYHTFYKTNQK